MKRNIYIYIYIHMPPCGHKREYHDYGTLHTPIASWLTHGLTISQAFRKHTNMCIRCDSNQGKLVHVITLSITHTETFWERNINNINYFVLLNSLVCPSCSPPLASAICTCVRDAVFKIVQNVDAVFDLVQVGDFLTTR